MYFREVSLRNFRNFESLTLELNSGLNLFVGLNGQGKTNFLEALHLLVRGSSFRPGRAETWIKNSTLNSAPNTWIKGQIEKKQLLHTVELKFQDTKLHFFLNQKRFSGHHLSVHYPSVIFSPESLSAIKDGPESRRQLIDDFLQTHNFDRSRCILEFRKTLRMRNRLLRDYKKGIYFEKQIHTLLDALDEIYLKTATTLTFERLRALHEIFPFYQQAIFEMASRDIVDISVDYEISSAQAFHWSFSEIEQNIRNRLKLLRKSELMIGSSLVGPHKHEIKFLTKGYDARYFCSQGQQRTLILGFKMAQIMYHNHTFQIHPLLLLDDVLSELDPLKCANLLKFMESIRSQIILTTTDIGLPFDFGHRGRSVFRINRGQVESLL